MHPCVAWTNQHHLVAIASNVRIPVVEPLARASRFNTPYIPVPNYLRPVTVEYLKGFHRGCAGCEALPAVPALMQVQPVAEGAVRVPLSIRPSCTYQLLVGRAKSTKPQTTTLERGSGRVELPSPECVDTDGMSMFPRKHRTIFNAPFPPNLGSWRLRRPLERWSTRSAFSHNMRRINVSRTSHKTPR